jgi:hypothetical protein
MTARSVPSLQIRHGDGDQWWVAAIWPDGQVEDIASFDSELEANEWIAKDFQRWLEQRNARNEC